MRPVGPLNARIALVADLPSEEDVRKGVALEGFAGSELNRMLAEAGIQRGDCFVTSVLRVRPPGGDL